MVSLEIGIDASGVASGGAQASSALAGVAQAAALASNALAGSSAAAAGLGAALTTAMPWITAIGAALSGITTGLLLFSDNTKQATTAWSKFVDVMREANALEQVGGFFPGIDSDFSKVRQQGAFNAAKTLAEDSFLGTAESRGLREFGSEIGLDRQGTQQRLRQIALGRGAGGDQFGQTFDIEDLMGFRIDPNRAREGFGALQIAATPEGQIQLLADFAERQRIARAAQRPAGGFSLARPGLGPGFSLPDQISGTGFPGVGSGVAMSEYRQTIIDNQIGQRDAGIADAESLQRMDELREKAMEVGAALGDGAWDFFMGISSAKDVLGNFAAEIGRGIFRDLATQAASGLADAFSTA